MPRFDKAKGRCALHHSSKALERVQTMIKHLEGVDDTKAASYARNVLPTIEGFLKQTTEVLEQELDRCAVRDPWQPPGLSQEEEEE